MSDYTIEELEGFLEEVNSRIAQCEEQMSALEDIMNSGDEQIVLEERQDRLIAKGIALVEAIDALKDAHMDTDMEVDDDD